ncbi:hypothetical protein OF83DRAFT_1220432 [Amylostereum chailletii]|nr:hypothetical protein OF83DRAFT_1220432 [Amylostereum chailletii]
MFDPRTPSCYPESIWLELTTPPSERHDDDPINIFIHPSSYWSIDVRDASLDPSLYPANVDIRFPTRTAFIDSLITAMLDPPIGFRHKRLHNQLQVYTVTVCSRTLPDS